MYSKAMSCAVAREGGMSAAQHSLPEGGDEALGQGVVVGIGRAAHAQGEAVGGGEIKEAGICEEFPTLPKP
jgi:hypothetical protein